MKIKVITRHESNYPNPINLKKGEWVETGKEDDQYPGWIWTTTQNGDSGWVPKQILSRKQNQALILENYCAKELPELREEDFVEVKSDAGDARS